MDVDKVVSAAQRGVVSAEALAAGRMQRYLVEAQRRLQADLRRGWPGRLSEESRVWREARARALLQQVSPALKTLRLGDPENGINGVVRQAILDGRRAEQRQTNAVVRAMTRGAPGEYVHMAQLLSSVENVMVDLQAVEAQVLNAAARLNKHSVDTIEKINTSVVNGLVRGSGFQPVAREIRQHITGPPGVRGGLAFHAETIARTELLSSLNDARETRYREAGISQVVWVATGDERTCEYCGYRSGKVYALSDVIIPAHPRCRCTTVPHDPSWVDDGLVDPGDYETHRADVESAFAAAHKDDGLSFNRGATPFERAAGVGAPTPLEMPTAAAKVAPVAAVLESTPWQPLDVEPAMSESEAASRRWFDAAGGSSDEERTAAVRTYTGSGYRTINGHLRGTANDIGREQYKRIGGDDFVRQIDAAFELPESRITKDMRLYRGYDVDIADVPADVRNMVGTVIEDPGYVSTSVDPRVSAGFMGGWSSNTRSSVFVEVRARAGQRGIPVESFTMSRGESEVVLPRGTRFRIVEAERKAPGSNVAPAVWGDRPEFHTEFVHLVVEIVE